MKILPSLVAFGFVFRCRALRSNSETQQNRQTTAICPNLKTIARYLETKYGEGKLQRLPPKQHATNKKCCLLVLVCSEKYKVGVQQKTNFRMHNTMS